MYNLNYILYIITFIYNNLFKYKNYEHFVLTQNKTKTSIRKPLCSLKVPAAN